MSHTEARSPFAQAAVQIAHVLSVMLCAIASQPHRTMFIVKMACEAPRFGLLPLRMCARSSYATSPIRFNHCQEQLLKFRYRNNTNVKRFRVQAKFNFNRFQFIVWFKSKLENAAIVVAN